MPVALSGNMRARSTARVGAARVANVRCGGVAEDVDTANAANHYVWTMERGVKPIDSSLGITEDGWTTERR